ncbi:MAG: hypothetical protein KDA27_17260 [Candidatus Eisenbacteria bacterium]|uniref:TIGR03435 family protein n=1 Tax=Eiseniibacteriota bacterium TaxID=2212470 RepID=A0A956NEZ5_UNCEI|nr:hypothetical protein [Candidatus Eisenbacteria bacterium]MCB9466552.1 hypothetical protein [Candidatus Eisenbacteria bacterium]
MLRLRYTYVFVLLAAVIGALAHATDVSGASSAAESSPTTGWFLDLLPVGETPVDVMIVAEAEPNPWLAKMMVTVAQDREWWVSHVASAPRGEPIAYDARLGLTKAEYDSMLAHVGGMHLTKIADASLRVERLKDGVFRLHGSAAAAAADGIVVDLNENRVQTPYGIAAAQTRIEASDRQSMTGPWNGMQWKIHGADEEPPAGDIADLSMSVAQFCLGRLTESGRGILFYRASRIEPGLVKTAESFLCLTFEPGRSR